MRRKPDDCCATNSFRLPEVHRLQRESASSPVVFVSERGSPFTSGRSPLPSSVGRPSGIPKNALFERRAAFASPHCLAGAWRWLSVRSGMGHCSPVDLGCLLGSREPRVVSRRPACELDSIWLMTTASPSSRRHRRIAVLSKAPRSTPRWRRTGSRISSETELKANGQRNDHAGRRGQSAVFADQQKAQESATQTRQVSIKEGRQHSGCFRGTAKSWDAALGPRGLDRWQRVQAEQLRHRR
jgi:hypothetical protein